MQLLLLNCAPSFSIASNAHARNAYGTVAQELACAALTLSPIPIDGRCATCFDAEARGQFYEIKSVHRSGKLVVYDWRIEKEAAHPTLQYLLVVHRARRCRTATALLTVLHQWLELWLIPAATVHAAAALCPLRQLQKPASDPRNGYSRAGYVRGYRNVPLSPLQPAQAERIHFTCYAQPWFATFRHA